MTAVASVKRSPLNAIGEMLSNVNFMTLKLMPQINITQSSRRSLLLQVRCRGVVTAASLTNGRLLDIKNPATMGGVPISQEQPLCEHRLKFAASTVSFSISRWASSSSLARYCRMIVACPLVGLIDQLRTSLSISSAISSL